MVSLLLDDKVDASILLQDRGAQVDQFLQRGMTFGRQITIVFQKDFFKSFKKALILKQLQHHNKHSVLPKRHNLFVYVILVINNTIAH